VTRALPLVAAILGAVACAKPPPPVGDPLPAPGPLAPSVSPSPGAPAQTREGTCLETYEQLKTTRSDWTDPTARGRVEDADRVIASLRPQFKQCFQVGLESNPNLAGCMLTQAVIEPDGKVAATNTLVSDGQLGREVEGCMLGVIRNATFTPPTARARLNIPLTFKNPSGR
jgi:hypothetical protein